MSVVVTLLTTGPVTVMFTLKYLWKIFQKIFIDNCILLYTYK